MSIKGISDGYRYSFVYSLNFLCYTKKNEHPMDFKDLQNKLIQNAMNYGKRYNIKIDEDIALLKLYEEIGELTQAILIYRKKSRPSKYSSKKVLKMRLAKEFADVMGVIIVNAHLLGIDMEEALNKKMAG